MPITPVFFTAGSEEQAIEATTIVNPPLLDSGERPFITATSLKMARLNACGKHPGWSSLVALNARTFLNQPDFFRCTIHEITRSTKSHDAARSGRNQKLAYFGSFCHDPSRYKHWSH
jgi:hypothetical protein